MLGRLTNDKTNTQRTGWGINTLNREDNDAQVKRIRMTTIRLLQEVTTKVKQEQRTNT